MIPASASGLQTKSDVLCTIKPQDNTQEWPSAISVISNVPWWRSAEVTSLEDDQSWYWSAEWQAMEREADENLKNGEYEDFDTIDDFIASL